MIPVTLNGPATRRRRPPASRLGLNPLTFALLTSTVALAAVSAVSFRALGLTLHIGDAWVVRGTQAAVALVAWAYYFGSPGRPKEWINAEASAAFLACLLIAAVVTPSQYAAAALARPTVDHALARADALLGIHVPSLVAWARDRPMLAEWLRLAYGSLMLQFTLIIPTLWLRNDRRSIWEYAFNFHTTAKITMLSSAVWPVACAFEYYGFESLVSQARFTEHFTSIRAGTMTVVDMTDMEGLVSMPSFHVAGALIVTWSLRRSPWLVWPLAILNLGLIASTVLTGAHYGVDILAAMVLVLASILVYRRIVEPWWLGGEANLR
jgi:membrane-associated phospholipid phosphatase